MTVDVPKKPLDPSKLIFNENPNKGANAAKADWGNFTDHMLTVKYNSATGWADPVIGPYGEIAISPAAVGIQYAQSLFEGMKAYRTPSGSVQIFRPDMNMARMRRSADRLTFPDFDPEALTTLIKRLIDIDSSFVPEAPRSLYIRPTIVGTRPTLGMTPSDECLLVVFLCPVGSMFKLNGLNAVSVVSLPDTVRAWPGGTGDHKLALNYGAGLAALGTAHKLGYDAALWVNEDQVTECGGMNFWVAYESDDGVKHLITSPLNGLVLPGVTRDSILTLFKLAASGEFVIPGLPEGYVIEERQYFGSDLKKWSAEGRLLEAFGSGTAAVICPVAKIGFTDPKTGNIQDLVLPTPADGVAEKLFSVLTDIQWGKIQGPPGWQVPVA